jgi:hypothetical protein
MWKLTSKKTLELSTGEFTAHMHASSSYMHGPHRKGNAAQAPDLI